MSSRESIVRLMSIHRVAIKRETVTTGSSMGPIRSYATVTGKSSVPCRCVAGGWQPTEEAGVRGHREPWTVRFPDYPGALDERNVLVFRDSKGASHNLQVQRVINPHDLEYFWRVNCLELADVPVRP